MPYGRIDEVHGAASSPGASGFAAVDLGDELRHAPALGQVVAVRAVSAENVVPVVEGGADPRRDGLLARIEMTGAADFPIQDGLDKALFAEPDPDHGPIQMFQ